MGNFVIKFLDHNGMRPVIVLVVIIGGILITLKSDKICVIQEPPSVTGSQAKIILRDNPVCSKYFEMGALVIGGILGLTVPAQGKNASDSRVAQQQNNMESTPSSSDPTNTKGSESQNTPSK
ncbi:MAG: hypothetical protein HEQ35_25885 [Gloeotrichia echinulata IR180]|nr:hypothetical protein [Gloeotrichia echinulata DEX184]